MSGTGDLVKAGAGKLTLSGANTYTGGTSVTDGSLEGNATSLQGDITNDANVEFNQATDGSYAGNMSGTGSLTKAGAGTLVMTGANTYSGDTVISDGRLVVNGTLGSNVIVNGSELGGSGTIAGSVVNSGIVGPGNSIDTLTIQGQYTQQAGSTLEIEIDDGGTTPGVNSDLLATDATTINGGGVVVDAQAGSYTAGSTYHFLSSATAIQGQFDTITDNLADLNAVLGYDFDGSLYWAYFTFQRLETDYAAFAQTPNQLAVANYLDGISVLATGDLATVLDGLNTLTGDPAAMQAAFDAMSGQVDPTLAAIGLQNTTLVVQQLAGQLRNGSLGQDVANGYAVTSPVASEPAGPIMLVSYEKKNSAPRVTFVAAEQPDAWRGWMFGYGLGGSAKSDGNAAGLTYGMGGTLLGAERRVDGGRVGFFGGYQGTSLRLTGPVQTGHINGGMLGSYLYNDDGFNYYTVIGGLQFNGFDTQRLVQYDGINRTAAGNFSGWLGYSYLERGVTYRTQRAAWQPYAALQYIYLRQNSYTETGADSLNLAVSGIDANSLRSLVGGRVQSTHHTRMGNRLSPELRALWLHEFLQTDVAVNSFFAPVGGGSFAIQGLNLGRDWAIIGGGLNYELPGGWQLYANYDAQVNTQQVFHVGSGGAQVTW
jgi:outer membrane autotransporter protein